MLKCFCKVHVQYGCMFLRQFNMIFPQCHRILLKGTLQKTLQKREQLLFQSCSKDTLMIYNLNYSFLHESPQLKKYVKISKVHINVECNVGFE